MKVKNKITGITFIRMTDDVDNQKRHEIVLHLESEIPAIGYGAKKLRKMLKDYDKPYIYSKA
jgi:hypothetical protein